MPRTGGAPIRTETQFCPRRRELSTALRALVPIWAGPVETETNLDELSKERPRMRHESLLRVFRQLLPTLEAERVGYQESSIGHGKGVAFRLGA